MEQLQELADSAEFAAVKEGVLSLNPLLLVDQNVGPHLLALRTGLLGVVTALERARGDSEPVGGEYVDGEPTDGEPADGEPEGPVEGGE